MQDYIPVQIANDATSQLIAEASKISKTTIDHKDVKVLMETLHLKDPHVAIPTLYKIVIRYPYGPVESRSQWGVWTETGQRIQLQ
jgi:hypothetical protein